jgi:quercetin dioxygenase-like cupin family protein
MALHHLAPGEKFRLASKSSLAEAKTAALVKADTFEVAQLVLRSGESTARHSVPGHAIIHCLEGAVILDGEGTIELGAGDWLYLDRGEDHSVAATQDSVLLLTILFD